MSTTSATAVIDQAGGRLCAASKTNHELVCDLRNKVDQLRSRLLGPAPQSESDAEKCETSGLIFNVSNELEKTNQMLRESIDIVNILNREFDAEQQTARAS